MKDTDEHLKALGNQIRILRKKKGLSQEKLALLAFLDRSYMGSIERGERNITFSTLVKVAKVLQCKICDLTLNIPL